MCEPLTAISASLGILFAVSEALGISSRMRSGCASLTEVTYIGIKTFYQCHCKNECEEQEVIEIEMQEIKRSNTEKMREIIKERNNN